jgi:ATP-binding cassette subfamily B protein
MFAKRNYEVNRLYNERLKIERVTQKEIVVLQRHALFRYAGLYGMQLLLLALCAYLISHNMLSIAAVVFIVTYLSRFTNSAFSINGIIRSLEQGFLDAAKVTELLSIPQEVTDKKEAVALEVNGGEVTFNNVTFSYADAKNEHVFDDLNLKIPAGQRIGLVGKSGGGKTTLTSLLLRYMDINNGAINIDGQNIADVTQDSLRNSIAYVPQDPFLFHRTLRENIAYGQLDATDQQIIDAAEKAHAMEFINKLPNGINTVVGERGIKLSGGQRQRIAIARAFLKDSPILVLDEATSALDSESEHLIQQSLQELMSGRTSIVVAHRLSTIAKLDRIVVLNDGQIIEDGSHEELLNNDSLYATLWKRQSGGFIEE